MSAYFEIAYATACGRLCLFTGTGFSKAVSGNAAPSWQGLLEAICDELTEPLRTGLKDSLFPDSGKNPLSLEEAAQIIALRLISEQKEIHQLIADKIRPIGLAGDNSVIVKFLQEHRIRVITTNYDKLLEQLAGPVECQSLAPGLPVPRSQARVRVYHVHGSIDSPGNMVVTSDDYFRFLNAESYFSRKLSTVLHENCVVIMGYSLSDTNLKAILSDYSKFSREHVISGNVFLVSRDPVTQYVKDYYSHCYGIRVLDRTEIHKFFSEVANAMVGAQTCVDRSKTSIEKVLSEGHRYLDDYLKIYGSFFEIIASVSAIGRSVDDPAIVKILEDVIRRKNSFTSISGAWDQYDHLASWLVHLGSILDLRGTSIQDVFLQATLHSMNTMSKANTLGKSWKAYKLWDAGWFSLKASNRQLIKEYITARTHVPDALEIVDRG